MQNVVSHDDCVPWKLAALGSIRWLVLVMWNFCSLSAAAFGSKWPLVAAVGSTSNDAALVFQLLLSIPHSFWFYFVLLHCAFCSSTAAALGSICGPDVVM